MKYEPYKLDAFTQLLAKAYRYGWYSGRQDLISVVMRGDFEGWSGRATETWEHRFWVTFHEPAGDNKQKFPGKTITEEGETIEEACQKILNKLQHYTQPHVTERE